MELSELSTNQLLGELQARAEHGITVLSLRDAARLDVYWGERTQCLGLASRISHVIERELDELEDAEELEDQEDSPAPDPAAPFGNYL